MRALTNFLSQTTKGIQRQSLIVLESALHEIATSLRCRVVSDGAWFGRFLLHNMVKLRGFCVRSNRSGDPHRY